MTLIRKTFPIIFTTDFKMQVKKNKFNQLQFTETSPDSTGLQFDPAVHHILHLIVRLVLLPLKFDNTARTQY